MEVLRLKIVATSDTHFYTNYSLLERADVFIHAGDLMAGGSIKEWQAVRGSLCTAKAQDVYVVPGNHDRFIEEYPSIARDSLIPMYIDLILPDTPARQLSNGLMLLGVPFVINLPKWAYNRTEEQIAEYLEFHSDKQPDIVVSHGPPFSILDRTAGDEHVGSRAMMRWWNGLEKKPKLWICGHIHEGYGKIEKEGTLFANVSMCDEHYKQVNAPMVFEI